MQRSSVYSLVFIAVLGSASSTARPAYSSLRQETGEPTLQTILYRLQRAARLYSDQALRFTCDERIVHWRFRPNGSPARRTHERQYFYVRSATPGGDETAARLLDYRTQRAEAEAGSEPEEVQLEALGLPSYLTRAYSWIFIFQKTLQSRYRFELIDRERVLGRSAAVITFAAIPPYEKDLNDWFGKAWVDVETFQLLRVEGLQAKYHERLQELRQGRGEARADRNADIIIEATTEFREEKNGMRFPSDVVVTGTQYRIRSPLSGFGFRSSARLEERDGLAVIPVFEVEQSYKNYRFFSVRTSSEIRRRIIGDGPPN